MWQRRTNEKRKEIMNKKIQIKTFVWVANQYAVALLVCNVYYE